MPDTYDTDRHEQMLAIAPEIAGILAGFVTRGAVIVSFRCGYMQERDAPSRSHVVGLEVQVDGSASLVAIALSGCLDRTVRRERGLLEATGRMWQVPLAVFCRDDLDLADEGPLWVSDIITAVRGADGTPDEDLAPALAASVAATVRP